MCSDDVQLERLQYVDNFGAGFQVRDGSCRRVIHIMANPLVMAYVVAGE